MLRFSHGLPPHPVPRASFPTHFFWKRIVPTKKKRHFWGGPWNLRSEISPKQELNFHKIGKLRKKKNMQKSATRTDPIGGSKNRFGDPICRRVGELAAPPGTIVCLSASAMSRKSMARLPKPKNRPKPGPSHKTRHRQTRPEDAQKRQTHRRS